MSILKRIVKYFTFEKVISCKWKSGKGWIVTTNKKTYYSKGGDIWYDGKTGKMLVMRYISLALEGAVNLHNFTDEEDI